jgi:hypothetical protein
VPVPASQLRASRGVRAGPAGPAQADPIAIALGNRVKSEDWKAALEPESNLHRVQHAAPRRSGVGRIAVVEHQVVAVRVCKEGHMADAGVENIAFELDALGLELGARGGDVVAP